MTMMHNRYSGFKDSSDESSEADPYNLYEVTPKTNQPLSLLRPQNEQRACCGDRLGTRGRDYMVIQKNAGMGEPIIPLSVMTDGNGSSNAGIGMGSSRAQVGKSNQEKGSVECLLNSIGDPDGYADKVSALLLQLINTPGKLIWFTLAILGSFFFFPMISTLLVSALGILVLFARHPNDDNKMSKRTAKWTLTGFSQQMKDGFLASPPFLDKCGQWRMVIKQKRTMDGYQTSFGLMCTDIFPDIEMVTATTTFFCTNQLGQEINTGGMRTLEFQHVYQCPGDCGFGRAVRLSKRHLGPSEVIILHCSVQFQKKSASFFKSLLRNLQTEEDNEEGRRTTTKKGKNIVKEHGAVFPGDLEFHEKDTFPPAFRPVMRFVQHSDTRTFIWEIPAFTSILESSELWGVYSPQFFICSHDVCSIWRMKLLEVQGVFRLHVQLRGLPSNVKQVKLWYLIQLVDLHGDSIIPEHAMSRVKYPDHMNLWETTRHILYRRETMLERFIGDNGSFTLRVSLQMEPNDVSLMEVDSDEWIRCPSARSLERQMQPRLEGPTAGAQARLLHHARSPMIGH